MRGVLVSLGGTARILAALAIGLLVAVPVVATTAAPAHACRCAPSGVGQQARAADLVVAGTVLQVRDDDARQNRQDRQNRQNRQDRQNRQNRGGDPGRGGRLPQLGNVTLVVGVDRIYAGQIPDPTIEVTTSLATSACGLGRVPENQRYFFFLSEDATALRATSCNGTSPASDREAQAIEAALGEGRPVTETEPPTAVRRTLVGERDTPGTAMMAAPGGVLAVAGLIGLVVLGGVGSRR